MVDGPRKLPGENVVDFTYRQQCAAEAREAAEEYQAILRCKRAEAGEFKVPTKRIPLLGRIR